MALEYDCSEPIRATMIRQYDVRLEWTPEKDYVAGSSFQIRLGSLRSFVDWRFVEWHVAAADITYRWKVDYDPSDMRKNPHRVLIEARLQYGARKGESITIDTRAVPSHWAGVNADLSIWVRDTVGRAGAFDESAEAAAEAGSQCRLVTLPGPVERLLAFSRVRADSGVRTTVTPTDRFGNPSSFAEPASLSLRSGEKTITREISGPTHVDHEGSETGEAAEVEVGLERFTAEEAVRNGRRDGSRYAIRANPVVRAEDAGGLKPVFGEIHWHTDFSADGARPMDDALSAARDAYALDFVAPADHNPAGAIWDATVAALERFNKPGEFVTVFGWEASSDRGHENLYFTEPDHPLVCGGSAGYRGGRPESFPQDLGDLPPYIRVPHHTNAVAETRNVDTDVPYWHPYPWNRPSEDVRLAEIMQARGNQERNSYSDVWRGWHQHHGSSLQDALRQGYRIGFTGGTDNHCGWPGRSFAEMEGDAYTQPPHTTMLTGVWVEELDRKAVFDGLYRRHTWAVCDTRAIVRFLVNGVLGGGDLTVSLGDALSSTISIWAEDYLATVEIVREGRVVWAGRFDSETVHQEIELGAAEADTHFYLRGLQRNGAFFYASPVFVSIAE